MAVALTSRRCGNGIASLPTLAGCVNQENVIDEANDDSHDCAVERGGVLRLTIAIDPDLDGYELRPIAVLEHVGAATLELRSFMVVLGFV